MADPVLTAALAADGAWLLGAVKIELPEHTIRLIDGSAEVWIGGEKYAGEDDVFGTLAAIEQIGEDMGDEAPEVRLALYPKNASALATLANPAMQGCRVTIMLGAVDPATMTPIGQPEVVFLGEIDTATLVTGDSGRRVEYSIVSVFDRLFEVDEGQRASDGWHQSIWPGERGLEYMTGTTDPLYWGSKPPSGSSATAGHSGSGISLNNSWQTTRARTS